MWDEVRSGLCSTDLSPQQVGKQVGISHERVYQWVYDQIAAGRPWQRHLRTQRPARHRRRDRAAAARAQAARRARPIQERPQAANERTEFGHFEIDLLHGRRDCKCAVLVIKERTSRLTLLRKLPGRDAKTVTRVIRRALKPYKGLVHTITTDNGTEFSNHAELETKLGCQMYVCDPHSPWQRGQVEGENKNIRQYLPKGFDVDRMTRGYLATVQRKLNSRPKRVLNDSTPAEVAFLLSGVALRG
jgi:IS30 family transposase